MSVKNDELELAAQAHYDKREKLFHVNDFSREVIATESFKLGAQWQRERDQKTIERLNKALTDVDWHIRTIRNEGILNMQQMIRALKVISDALKDSE